MPPPAEKTLGSLLNGRANKYRPVEQLLELGVRHLEADFNFGLLALAPLFAELVALGVQPLTHEQLVHTAVGGVQGPDDPRVVDARVLSREEQATLR